MCREGARMIWDIAFWRNPRFRAAMVQAGLLALAVWIVWSVASNTSQNLAARNIVSGWDFLWRGAGFDVVFSIIPYSSDNTYARALFVGFLNTLLVAVLGIVFATLLGLLLGMMRLSKNWIVSRSAELYIEVMRNVPLLLQLFIWYKLVLKPLPDVRNAITLGGVGALSNKGLTLPAPLFGEGAWVGAAGLAAALVLSLLIRRWATARQANTGEAFPAGLVSLGLIIGLPLAAFALAGWPLSFDYPVIGTFNFKGGMTLVPEFMALLIGLSTYTAAFIGEAVRAGIQSVGRGQGEAAQALGLQPAAAMRLVILPQAFRVIIPPMTSQYLNLTKNSSLAVAIAYPDLVSTGGTTLNQTGQAIEVVVIWMAVYLGLSLATAAFMNWFNARYRLVER
jgi:general L-amino acid transport system permease protein